MGTVLWLANNGNPPTGKTAAPFDGNCNDCHTGSSYNGNLEITGFPATADANTVYNITVKMTATAGSPVKAGMQLVVVDDTGSHANCGDLIESVPELGTESLAGREYMEHRGGKNFAANVVSWDFQWKAPASVPGNTIRVYCIVNMVNGNGGNGGDNPVWDDFSFAFSGPPPVVATITETVNPNCNGGNNGSATVEGSGGTPPYSYHWSNNQTTQTAIDLVAGSYSVTVKGAGSSGSATAVATLTQPPLLTLSTSVSGTVTCVDVATATATVGGGTPGYTYNWSDGQTNAVATFDMTGTYAVTATDDNGCTKVATVNITGNTTAPIANAGPNKEITCQVEQVQLDGSGSSTGANFSYNWTTVGGNIVSGGNTLSPMVNSAGTYTLQVTNTANGCTATALATVVQHIVSPFDSIAPHGNLNCNNASIQFNATPSSQGPDFKYLWTAKDGGHIVSGDTTLTPFVDSIGKYFLKITHIQTGCTALDSTVLKQSLAVTAAIDSVVNVGCNGAANGLARVAGGGGNGIYEYLWSNGVTTAIADGMIAGTYVATVTDGENCSASVTLNMSEPDLLVVNASATGETAQGANDGTATADPNGGTAAYMYNWSNGATTQTITSLEPGNYTVSVADANGCTAVQTLTVNTFGCNLEGFISVIDANCNGSNDGLASISLTGAVNPVSYAWSNGASTQSVNNLAPGQYMVSIVDGNNCPAVFNASIGEPVILSANASTTGVTINGGSDGTATATPAGGTPGYQYLWSTNATSATITDLAPGSYTVSVTDANGCSSQQTVEVSAFICALSATVSSSNTLCFGGADGQASIVANGGVLPYTYLWSNGDTTQIATNLASGTYTVVSTDAGGCKLTSSVSVGEPDQLVVTVLAVQNVLCPADNTGGATIGVVGGTAPYTFHWPGGNANNLGVGSYTVSITDANGCFATTSFEIIATDNEPPTMTCPTGIQICGANIVSYGAPSATDNCGIGMAPTLLSGPPSGSIFNDGEYVIVYQSTDVSGNSATCSFSIIVNSVPDILIDTTANDVNGQGVGAISVTPVGNGPFSYAWNKDGQSFANTEDLTGLGVGSYTLTVTDINSCTSALAPIFITNTVGTSEPGISGTVKLWPNPAMSAIQLEIIDVDVIAAVIVDLRGSLIQSIQAAELSGEIDIKSLQAGVYCLKIITANGRVLSVKFIKAN